MLIDRNLRLAKALDRLLRFETPPPDDLEDECLALRKRIKTKVSYARKIIELCGDSPRLEALEFIVEACDNAGPTFAKTTLKWAPRFLEAAGDFSHIKMPVRIVSQGRIYQILARAYEATGQWDKALDALKTSFAINNCYGHSVALSVFYTSLRRFDEAIACIEESRALHFTHKAFLGLDVTWEPKTAKERNRLNTLLRNLYKSMDWRLDELTRKRVRYENELRERADVNHVPIIISDNDSQ